MSRPIKNLTSQHFGRWLVLRQAPNKISGSNTKTCWNCQCTCGTLRNVTTKDLLRKTSQSCGCLRRELLTLHRSGPNNPNWKGGKWHTKNGYVHVMHNGKQQHEHRIIMKNHLGRDLEPKETVHHKNGIPNDNRLDNLELWSSSHPSGQRVADKLQWCLQFIKKYAPHYLNGNAKNLPC